MSRTLHHSRAGRASRVELEPATPRATVLLITTRQKSATSWKTIPTWMVKSLSVQLEDCSYDHVQLFHSFSKHTSRKSKINHVTKYTTFILGRCRVRRHSEAPTKPHQRGTCRPVFEPPTTCSSRATTVPTRQIRTQAHSFTFTCSQDFIG